MSLKRLIKIAGQRVFMPRVQQTPQAQQYGASHGVDPYALQNNMGAALQQLTMFTMNKRKPVTNALYAFMQQPDGNTAKKTTGTQQASPIITPFQAGTGWTGATDAFAQQHSLGTMEGPGEKVLSTTKNKNFMKMPTGITNGKGNPTSRTM